MEGGNCSFGVSSSAPSLGLEQMLSNCSSPFTCDLAAAIENIPNMDSVNPDVDHVAKEQLVVEEEICHFENVKEEDERIESRRPSTCSNDSSKDDFVINVKVRKRNRIRRRINPISSRIYVCEWCNGEASFKSCQGLRFHKTLRCPQRELKLGENYFKCTKCKKAFVTNKGLNHHMIEQNHWP